MKKYFIYFYNICNQKRISVFIGEENGNICFMLIDTKKKLDGFEKMETPLLKEASKQLTEYFDRKRKKFDLPLALNGTEFQVKTWKALQSIPYGKTCSYGDLAKKIGNPKASRAVGNANNRNPLHIIVPCHRVIGSNGSLTGYAAGLDVKRLLLDLENH